MSRAPRWIDVTLTLCLSIVAAPVTSSTTEAAFQKCNKIAVAELEYCLIDHPLNQNSSCWRVSQDRFSHCVKGIIAQHNKGDRAERARRAKQIELQRERVGRE